MKKKQQTNWVEDYLFRGKNELQDEVISVAGIWCATTNKKEKARLRSDMVRIAKNILRINKILKLKDKWNS